LGKGRDRKRKRDPERETLAKLCVLPNMGGGGYPPTVGMTILPPSLPRSSLIPTHVPGNNWATNTEGRKKSVEIIESTAIKSMIIQTCHFSICKVR
jgi:hypothetical protein